MVKLAAREPTNTYFRDVMVKFDGHDSKDPFAYKWYQPNKKIQGKTMAEWLSMAVCYWHTFKGSGADPFGPIDVYNRPWGQGDDPMKVAENTMDAAFELFTKLGVDYWCFHDRDIAPEGDTVKQSKFNLQKMVDLADAYQRGTGKKNLWGTANLFSHPRYTHGAATNPDTAVIGYAACQVKAAIDATIQLGGRGYVFWGGREGYEALINTDMKKEREQLGAFLTMARDYGRSQGFKGKFYIEPKPREPSSHQYDYDAATCLAFLKEFGLEDDFELNLENNHATLAGHTFQHDVVTAANAGKLGSMDINRGDPTCGWDTDQFLTDPIEAALVLMPVMQQGGLSGGCNFDAKVRRGSTDLDDIFHAHIGSVDALAKGLLIADYLIREGTLSKPLVDRYASSQTGMGKKIAEGTTNFKDIEKWVMRRENGGKVLTLRSGRQELLENKLREAYDAVIRNAG